MSGNPDPALRGVWTWTFLLFGLLAWTLVGGPAFLAFGIMLLVDGDTAGWWMAGTAATVLVAYLGWMLWYIPAALARWKWELFADHVSVTQGVVFHTTKRIPYARIQDVAVKQGPLRRRAGLSTLEIQTASLGSSVSSEGTLPGVRDADDLAMAILAHVDRGD